jgi:hypothetical protein
VNQINITVINVIKGPVGPVNNNDPPGGGMFNPLMVLIASSIIFVLNIKTTTKNKDNIFIKKSLDIFFFNKNTIKNMIAAINNIAR